MREPFASRPVCRGTKRNRLRTFTLLSVALLIFTCLQLRAQSPAEDWEKATGAKIAFDVASVKVNNLGLPPVGPKQSFRLTGGYLSAVNAPLVFFIRYAYDVKQGPENLPKWASSERLDIQARASGNPTEDQIRLMLQSLLEDRFRFSAHYEMRQTPIYDLALSQPGKLGSQLRPFQNEELCPSSPPMSATISGGFPARCGGPPEPLSSSQPGWIREGGRNVTMAQIAGFLGVLGHLDRPVVDTTGSAGNFDFILEWDPRAADGRGNESTGISFIEALQDQLGLKLEAHSIPLNTFVVDHIEEPSSN